jgi:thiol-disulfide isomerase/thioredoxin
MQPEWTRRDKDPAMTIVRRPWGASLGALLFVLACERRADSVPPAEADAPPPLPAALHGMVKKSCGADEGLGVPMKPFSLQTVDGEPVNEGSWQGRVLLVNFWATWCKPCLRELPEFEKLHRHYESHGLTLVAIAGDEEPGPVKAYVDSSDITAKFVMGTQDYASQYGTSRYPFTLVVDADGVVRAAFFGYRRGCIGTIEAEIRRALETRGTR